ncbi:hypothetical protein, partial [Azohydromonas sediminis]|uniref:hypothetical protein n=1 Tax=Azohydromonas sediminis TaxID=2259674 RepID=UPI001B356197
DGEALRAQPRQQRAADAAARAGDEGDRGHRAASDAAEDRRGRAAAPTSVKHSGRVARRLRQTPISRRHGRHAPSSSRLSAGAPAPGIGAGGLGLRSACMRRSWHTDDSAVFA